MYAVIKTGGKQFKVEKGDRVTVEKLEGDVGADVVFDEVLLKGGDGQYDVGTPLVDGAKVTGKIVEQGRGERIIVYKHLRRKDHRKKQGHRQSLTTVEINSI